MQKIKRHGTLTYYLVQKKWMLDTLIVIMIHVGHGKLLMPLLKQDMVQKANFIFYMLLMGKIIHYLQEDAGCIQNPSCLRKLQITVSGLANPALMYLL